MSCESKLMIDYISITHLSDCFPLKLLHGKIYREVFCMLNVSYWNKCMIQSICIKVIQISDIHVLENPHEENKSNICKIHLIPSQWKTTKISYQLAISNTLTLIGPTWPPKYMPLVKKFRNHWFKLQLKQDSPKYMRNPQKKDLLDLVFTSNTSLAKSSTNIHGISDNAIILTDMDTKP